MFSIKSSWLFRLTGFLVIFCFTFQTVVPQVTDELCWERCFRDVVDQENNRYNEFYTDIFQTIMDIKAIININNITKIGYAIDSSISAYRDHLKNPEIFSTPTNQSAQHLFFLQFFLAHIFLFSLDNAPYLAQYDQQAAWTCEGFQCVIPCFFTRAIRWMVPFTTEAYSHCPDNVELACRLLENHMTTLPCALDANRKGNGLLLVITNSDFHSSLTDFEVHDPVCPRRPDFEHHSSSCGNFDHRYVISVNGGEDKYMRQFASKPNNFKRVNFISLFRNYVKQRGGKALLSVPCQKAGGV